MSERRGREAAQEDASVAFCKHSLVQKRENAPVRLAAYAAPESLLEQDDGFGNLVYDDATQPLPLHVHSLPEAARGEQDGVGSSPKLIEEPRLAFFALKKHRKGEPALEGVIDHFHLGITCEQNEGPSPAGVQDTL